MYNRHLSQFTHLGNCTSFYQKKLQLVGSSETVGKGQSYLCLIMNIDDSSRILKTSKIIYNFVTIFHTPLENPNLLGSLRAGTETTDFQVRNTPLCSWVFCKIELQLSSVSWKTIPKPTFVITIGDSKSHPPAIRSPQLWWRLGLLITIVKVLMWARGWGMLSR